MVFSSHIFVFYFLLLSLAAYYAAPKSWRHLTLTLLSYVFYGWWNPWFTLLMLGSTAVDYGCGKIISARNASAGKRKLGLLLSVISNLLVLAYFKYFAFFVGSVCGTAHMLGLGDWQSPGWVTHIILPVGISFYVFQSMSYCIDLYRGHARPALSFIDFACFVSLYPQLVAGPIVRYGSVAEQLRSREHTIHGFIMGIARFCLGFSKKILLADPLGNLADAAFSAGPESLSTAVAWGGALAYGLQIYFDFSAYSDMAIGLGRLFGFRFVENFNSPYRSASITEFWRRWHISLSTFLRDYLYIPLGGNRRGAARTYVNLMLVMLIGGLWHGANWTFVAWGGVHGLMLAAERFAGKSRPRLPRPLAIISTFVIVLFAWVFFRADNFDVALRHIRALCGLADSQNNSRLLESLVFSRAGWFYLLVGLLIVWALPNSQKLLEKLTLPKVVACLLLFCLSLGAMFQQGFSPFLYFQF